MSDKITITIAQLYRIYGLAVINTNNCEGENQLAAREYADDIRSVIRTVEGLSKTGHISESLQFLKTVNFEGIKK